MKTTKKQVSEAMKMSRNEIMDISDALSELNVSLKASKAILDAFFQIFILPEGKEKKSLAVVAQPELYENLFSALTNSFHEVRTQAEILQSMIDVGELRKQ